MDTAKDYELTDNVSENRYEFHIDGAIPVIEYRKKDNKIFLVHTEVPESLSGRGIAPKLVEAVLKDIESKHLTLVPLCPYVASYLKRHPEWNRLVDPQ